ncbi:MAG: histidine--tRNA ligase [Bdellovibrionales bacterium]|nr:histidine--tRNA ligase [Bdellovibrionales bacterium]
MAKVAIQPRVLKGFRDQLPQVCLARTAMLARITEVFASFGFVPIDTPALEYAEILLGKGSEETDKQLYRFRDNGDRDVALRFDLTVPLARFAAMHIHELGTPFRRYHIAPVWRAEKPQRGRFREFIQCDFDIIGPKSPLADAEILLVIHRCFKALGLSHRIRFNNRILLNALLTQLGIETKIVAVLRAIDKLEKIGVDAVREELETQADIQSRSADQIFAFLELSKAAASNRAVVEGLKDALADSDSGKEGIARVEQVLAVTSASGLTDAELQLDLSIARGLDYYTGCVFETALTELPEIGSVCSGGRYDNLAQLYTKQELPGVGASIGLDRVLAALEELERIPQRSSSATVLVALMDETSASGTAALATTLREKGLAVELYPQTAKLAQQLKYADRKGIEYVVLATAEQLARQVASVKEMRSGEQRDEIPIDALPTQLSSN